MCCFCAASRSAVRALFIEYPVDSPPPSCEIDTLRSAGTGKPLHSSAVEGLSFSTDGQAVASYVDTSPPFHQQLLYTLDLALPSPC